MKIAIIGAGWYGCHLAKTLLAEGHRVEIFERFGLFHGASGNNQFRVHLGFHYPRSTKTREEIATCWDRFTGTYPTVEVDDNYYGVSRDSHLDYGSYLAIMRDAGLAFEEVSPSRHHLRNLEGLIRVKERVVDVDACRRLFQDLPLRREQVTTVEQPPGSSRVEVNGEPFDACLNCSNLQIGSLPNDTFFEAAMILRMRGPADHFSLTVMDGNFSTLLATSVPGEFTLSNVALTSIARHATFKEAADMLAAYPWREHAHEFVDAMRDYCPDFPFEVIDKIAAVRTKLVNNTDSRELVAAPDGRLMTIICGKFASLFLAEEKVLQWLKHL